jgi:hypothetical protein|tara:strand:- start:3680 stop:4573 length:894 start_codon:yes stop_codon:yes gene_type:complete
MPLFERDGRKIYFIHIPKCAGSSLKNLLFAEGWSLVEEPWNHLHIPYSFWKNIEPIVNCDFKFTIVRNPLTRLSSFVNLHLSHQFSVGWEIYFDMQRGNIPINKDYLLEMWDRFDIHVVDENNHKISLKDIPWEAVQVMVEEWKEKFNAAPSPIANEIARSYIIKLVEFRYNKNWSDVTAEDLISMVFEDCNPHTDSVGGTPLPAIRYIDPDVHVFKIEDISSLLQKLYDENIISHEVLKLEAFPQENIRPIDFLINKPLFFTKPEIEKEFYRLYYEDFKLFGYDTPKDSRNTCIEA